MVVVVVGGGGSGGGGAMQGILRLGTAVQMSYTNSQSAITFFLKAGSRTKIFRQ